MINICILDIHPDTIRCAFIAKKAITEDITWHVLDPLITPGEHNIIASSYLSEERVFSYQNVNNLLEFALSSSDPVICFSEKDNAGVPLSKVVLEELFDSEETGFNVIKKRYDVKFSILKEYLSKTLSSVVDHYISRKDSLKKDSLSKVSYRKEKATRKLILIISDGYAFSTPGTGMYQLVERLCISLAKVAKLCSFNLKLTTESFADRLIVEKDDLVIMLSVNGMYMGGYTNVWQGFKISNLYTICSKVKAVGCKSLMVSSAHSSEFALYPSPRKDMLDVLNSTYYCGFHKAIEPELIKKGMNTLPGKSFPVPIGISWIQEQERIVSKTKTIMLQFDTQSRKNGEFILAALFDSYCLAFNDNPSLKVKVICKATAAHSFTNSNYLNRLKESWGINNYPGFEVVFEGRTTRPWSDTIKDIDIFMGLSTEEGLHYFIPELWIAGATIVLTQNGPCDSYENLPEGLVLIQGLKVDGSGTGFYNDNFCSRVTSFDYNDCVRKLSILLSSEIVVKDRKAIAHKFFDTDGSLISNFLGLEIFQQTKSYTVEREGSLYHNILQSPEWPR